MPAFDVTTNPTKLNPLKPGEKATIVVTATSRLPRPVTGRAMSVVVPDSFRNLVKVPAVAQKVFGQSGATQDFQFTVEIPADAKAGSCTTRFDVVDVDNKDDNFGQSAALKLEIEVPVTPPPPPPPKRWWIWVVVAVLVIGAGIVFWRACSGGGMPDVVGMSFTEAQAVLAEDSIRIIRRDTLNADTNEYSRDEVIEQNPKGGSKLSSDSNSVTLSVQALFTVVPAIRGQKPDSAGITLTAAGFPNLRAYSRCNTDRSVDGRVFSVNPDAGTLQARSTQVTFYVGAWQSTPCLRTRPDVLIEMGRVMIAVPPPAIMRRVPPDE